MVEYAEPMPDTCPGCGRRYQPLRVARSFTPCPCGDGTGHITLECLASAGGCGHVHLEGHVGSAPVPERMPNFGQL